MLGGGFVLWYVWGNERSQALPPQSSLLDAAATSSGGNNISASLLLAATATPAPSMVPTEEVRVVVYISGAVRYPNVYDVQQTARITDVVNAAGGFLPDAASEHINLAAHVQDALAQRGWHALLVPSADPHLSEYLPAHWQARQWLSGFTGSMGHLLITMDEASRQILSDQSASRQYPLSVLLDVFQSIQRKGVRFMLALTGLPTLFPKLVEARTYAERMFRVVFLNKLDDHASAQAIRKPTEKRDCPIKFSPQSIRHVIDMSGGYPYFIQFVCREIFDVWVQALEQRQDLPAIPVREITRKLDTDFFAGRWARATDRQRDLLAIIAALARSEQEFTVQEVVEQSRVSGERGFSPSHTSQMLWALCEHGLIYKNRHGRYSFAVPLFAIPAFALPTVSEPVLRFGAFAGVFVIMALLELAIPKRDLGAPKARRWATNLSMVGLGIATTRLMGLVAQPLVAVGAAIVAEANGWGLFNVLGLPVWVEIVAAIVILDFAVWLQHYASHVVPVLWRFHRMHHADTDIDVTTGLRFHPVEIGVSMLYKVGWVLVLGPAPLAVVL
ncbi:MAG: hypothetical protein HC828_16355, partial [Blastochloris sp.]|nr:hypothetical protein [Blastochloris sp.]